MMLFQDHNLSFYNDKNSSYVTMKRNWHPSHVIFFLLYVDKIKNNSVISEYMSKLCYPYMQKTYPIALHTRHPQKSQD